MTTRLPPGNLTEYVNNKEKKKVFLTKDQPIIQQTSRNAKKPQSLRRVSCSEGENLIKEMLWHTQTPAEQGKMCWVSQRDTRCASNGTGANGTWRAMWKGIRLLSERQKPNTQTMYQCSVCCFGLLSNDPKKWPLRIWRVGYLVKNYMEPKFNYSLGCALPI